MWYRFFFISLLESIFGYSGKARHIQSLFTKKRNFIISYDYGVFSLFRSFLESFSKVVRQIFVISAQFGPKSTFKILKLLKKCWPRIIFFSTYAKCKTPYLASYPLCFIDFFIAKLRKYYYLSILIEILGVANFFWKSVNLRKWKYAHNFCVGPKFTIFSRIDSKFHAFSFQAVKMWIMGATKKLRKTAIFRNMIYF